VTVAASGDRKGRLIEVRARIKANPAPVDRCAGAVFREHLPRVTQMLNQGSDDGDETGRARNPGRAFAELSGMKLGETVPLIANAESSIPRSIRRDVRADQKRKRLLAARRMVFAQPDAPS